MLEGHPSPIINAGMTVPRQPTEEPHPPTTARIVVAICGDPVVGRALTLLLRSCLYEARFLPVSSLSEPGALEGVGLLLLTPTWDLDAEGRAALVASLRGASAAPAAPILELTSSTGEARNGVAPLRPEHTVPWPCTTEELERRIQAALLAAPAGSNGHVKSAALEANELSSRPLPAS
jgi:hypothetical protein